MANRNDRLVRLGSMRPAWAGPVHGGRLRIEVEPASDTAGVSPPGMAVVGSA